MRYLPLAAALAASLTVCACATPNAAAVAKAAPTKPAAAAGTTAAAANSQNPQICARVETTGSRFPEKECHTASEWAAMRAQGNDDMGNRAQRQFSTPGGN